MTDVEAFVTTFHNLQGSTVAEKKRNFFDLLHANASLAQNSSLLDGIIPQLSAQTHLERIFLVDLLIYFRRYRELAKEFLDGDDIVVSKISKERWFFAKIFEENAAQFVDEFLPTLSYSLRMKVLKRLVLVVDEEQGDAIFDALQGRYGTFIASNILTGCSCAKIEQVLTNHPIQLWTSQLKLLYGKQPRLVRVYLEERVRHEGNAEFLNNNSIIPFIGMKDPEMFCHLLEKYKFGHCKVGKRSTKRIVRTKKDHVVAHPELYATNLNTARFVRTLGRDFEDVYFKIFPRDVNRVFSGWTEAAKLLQRYPTQRRFPLFQQTFDKVFHKSLEASCSSLNNHNFTYMIEMVTDAQEREKWALLKHETDKSDHFLKYCTSIRCLEGAGPKLNMSSPVQTRAGYIESMTESCLFCKDWQSLTSVLELLCNRFKNDDGVVFFKFFQALIQPRFAEAFASLDQNHWQYIKEIVLGLKPHQTRRLLTRTAICEIGLPDKITFKYFEYLCKHDKLTEEEVVELMEKVNWVAGLEDFRSDWTTEKAILLLMIKVAPLVIRVNYKLEKADVQLISACKRYNSRHKQKISIFDNVRLVQSVKSVLNRKGFDNKEELASVVEWMICCHKTHMDEELIQAYWGNFKKLATFNLTLWLLKYRPNLIMSDIEMFVSVVTAGEFCANHYYRLSTIPIWRLVKCYSHLQMDQTVLDHCTNELSDEKTSLAEPLSVIMASKDFVRLVETYKPDATTVDVLDDEENAQFELQRNLLKALVKSNAPEDVARVLLQFMRGDYVASCVSPLYSCLYKIPEDRVKTILDTLCATGAVSVRKHGFYFICATQEEASVLQKLESCRLSQSIAMSYQHFTKNPSPPSWELVKRKLTKLDNNDHFTSLLLVNKPAPKPYKAAYFERAFEIFRTNKNRFTNVLVDKLPEEVIGQLTNQFFAALKDDFLTMKKSELILSNYVLYCPEVFKYDVIFGALGLFREKRWSLRSHEAREKLKQFVMAFCTAYMKWHKTDASLVTSFVEGFVKIFPPVEAFDEYVMLSVMQFKSQNTLDLSRSVVGLHNRSINLYGKLVFEMFANCLQLIVDKICPDEICKFQLYASLLVVKKSVEDELLVIYLLPRTCPPLRDSAASYLEILELLRKSQNETVQLHLRQHFDREEAESQRP